MLLVMDPTGVPVFGALPIYVIGLLSNFNTFSDVSAVLEPTATPMTGDPFRYHRLPAGLPRNFHGKIP